MDNRKTADAHKEVKQKGKYIINFEKQVRGNEYYKINKLIKYTNKYATKVINVIIIIKIRREHNF